MKYILWVCFIIMLGGFGTGFFIKTIEENPEMGDKIIGLSVLFSTFIFMPLFLYHRWKGKDIKDYVLDKKKLDEMRNKDL
jgi:hypothetical protein